MKRVARPRGWPKKVFSEPEVLAESFVRLDAMVDPCWSGRVRLVSGTRPVGGSRHRCGSAPPLTPRGDSIRPPDPKGVRGRTRGTDRSGIHARGASSRSGPGPQVIHWSGPAGTGPYAKVTLGAKSCPKVIQRCNRRRATIRHDTRGYGRT